MPAHLGHKHRQGQKRSKDHFAPQPICVGVHIGPRVVAAEHAGGFAGAGDSRLQPLGIARQAAQLRRAVGEVDAGLQHFGQILQRAFDLRHTGRAAHPANGQCHIVGACRLARSGQRVRDIACRRAFAKRHMGFLRRQIDGNICRARDPCQRRFGPRDAGGAVQSINRKGKGGGGHRWLRYAYALHICGAAAGAKGARVAAVCGLKRTRKAARARGQGVLQGWAGCRTRQL